MPLTAFRQRFICLIALLTLITVVSCSEKELVFEQASYQHIPHLLGTVTVIAELGLQISSPKGWEMLDSADFDGFQKMIAGTELSRKLYPIYPLNAYRDTLTGSMLYVAQVGEFVASFSEIAGRYGKFLEERRKDSEMRVQTLIVNELEIYQYVFRSSKAVNYKLLGESSPGNRFLIEYIVPGYTFPGLSPAIQSSIASLSKSNGD